MRSSPYSHLVLATGAANRRLSCPGSDLAGVHGLRTLADAERLGAELGAARRAVVVGIGVVPATALAEQAGLELDNGVVVDGAMRTSDPRILAVGDCASFPSVHANARIRLESVQNATDQARHAAQTILGTADEYRQLPWFWSQQGNWKLQIAGLHRSGDRTAVRGEPATGKFSVFCFRDGRLAAVESVNRPADHMTARKLITLGTPLTPQNAADPDFDLKALVRSPTAA